MKINLKLVFYSLLILAGICLRSNAQPEMLAKNIRSDSAMNNVKRMATDLVETGFNAGSNYGEVWIRDFNTFITLSCKVFPADSVKKRLQVFFSAAGKRREYH